MRKLRHREIKWLAKDYTASKMESWALNQQLGSRVHTNNHAAPLARHQSPT